MGPSHEAPWGGPVSQPTGDIHVARGHRRFADPVATTTAVATLCYTFCPSACTAIRSRPQRHGTPGNTGRVTDLIASFRDSLFTGRCLWWCRRGLTEGMPGRCACFQNPPPPPSLRRRSLGRARRDVRGGHSRARPLLLVREGTGDARRTFVPAGAAGGEFLSHNKGYIWAFFNILLSRALVVNAWKGGLTFIPHFLCIRPRVISPKNYNNVRPRVSSCPAYR